VDSFPEARPESDAAGNQFEMAIDGFGPLDIVMANAGLNAIDVPFITMKNLTDHLGHPCCERQINCSIERAKEGISRYPVSLNAAHLNLDRTSP